MTDPLDYIALVAGTIRAVRSARIADAPIGTKTAGCRGRKPFCEMGNFLGAGLVVGQFVRQGPISVPVLVGGFVGWLLLQIGAIICTEEEVDD